MDELRGLFFEGAEGSEEKCVKLAERRDIALGLEVEGLGVSNSPGVVLDDEILARQVYSPIHVTKDGKLTPAALTDAFDKGLSCNRLSHASDEEIHAMGLAKAERDKAAGKERGYLGFACCSVDGVRSVIDASKVENDKDVEERAFAVFDSALPDAHHHSDVCSILPEVGCENMQKKGFGKKVLKKRRREKLFRLFGGLTSVRL